MDAAAVEVKNEQKELDVKGFEPLTSRMQSVRATTVPNAHNKVEF